MAHDGAISVDRAISLLMAFQEDEDSISLAQWSRRVELHKTTVLRLAASLERGGLVKRLPDGTFRLGERVLTLAMVLKSSLKLDKHIRPYLEEMCGRTAMSVSFYVRTNERRLCLLRIDPPNALRDSIVQGSSLPLDETATAQVLRRFSPSPVDVEPNTELPELPTMTSGLNDGQITSLSAPVFNDMNQLVGALTASCATFLLTEERVQAASVALMETANRLSSSLGAKQYPAFRLAKLTL